MNEAARVLGTTPDQIQIQLRIEKQAETVKQAAVSWGAQQGIALIGDPYAFSITKRFKYLDTVIVMLPIPYPCQKG
jgi:hypothetical protein